MFCKHLTWTNFKLFTDIIIYTKLNLIQKKDLSYNFYVTSFIFWYRNWARKWQLYWQTTAVNSIYWPDTYYNNNISQYCINVVRRSPGVVKNNWITKELLKNTCHLHVRTNESRSLTGYYLIIIIVN